MPRSSSWIPHIPEGVKGFDEDDGGDEALLTHLLLQLLYRELSQVTEFSRTLCSI